jgi:hypothetical protein
MPSDQTTEVTTGAESVSESTNTANPQVETRAAPEAPQQQSLPLETNGADAPEVPEFFDYVHDGNSYQLPGALQGVLKTQNDLETDYRKKTMALADERRQYEEQARFTQQQRNLEQQYGGLVNEARGLDQFIQQYRDANGFINVDWDRYEEQDPAAAAKLERKINRAQTRITDIQNAIARMDAQQHQEATRQYEQMMSQFENELPTKIAGWNDELKQKLSTFASTYGYNENDFSSINDPRAIQVLHDAMYGHQARQSATGEDDAAPQVSAQPVTTPGHSNQAKPKNKMNGKETPEEYRRKRIAQINAKQKR